MRWRRRLNSTRCCRRMPLELHQCIPKATHHSVWRACLWCMIIFAPRILGLRDLLDSLMLNAVPPNRNRCYQIEQTDPNKT